MTSGPAPSQQHADAQRGDEGNLGQVHHGMLPLGHDARGERQFNLVHIGGIEPAGKPGDGDAVGIVNRNVHGFLVNLNRN